MPRERFDPCPAPWRTRSLPGIGIFHKADKSIFVCRGCYGSHQIVHASNVIYAGGLGPNSTNLTSGKAERQGQPYLHATKSLGELLWLAILSICCHLMLLGKSSAVHMCLVGEDHCKFAPALFWVPPCVAMSSADFHLFPSTVINCKREHNSFSEVFGSS